MSPNILEVMSFRVGVFYPVTATTVVCCILMQILCVVSRIKLKLQLLGDFVPQTAYTRGLIDVLVKKLTAAIDRCCIDVGASRTQAVQVGYSRAAR